ncbi:MAG: FHA domain-containing protein [Propionibacteriaceae bacterium]|nr:FHA domain-containing protein [Propionibacteriaceae bacterium]
MARCVDGHDTQSEDFCDQCGMPVVATDPAQPAPGPAPEPSLCPNCGATRPTAALFCESCGYDYTTGALPQQDLRTELGLPPPTPDEAAEPGSATHAPDDPTAEAAADETPDLAADSPAPPVESAVGSAPTGHVAKHIPWVAEVWVDPQWYAFQESTDPLPPLGSPRVVPLKDSALIGRHSASRNINPDIDCEPDVGCSRRQAYLTCADGYWYVNDLDSANGTFVAPATASLPDEPITGRVQIGADTRVYVGAWTRIVVRPAVDGDPVL